MKLYKVLNVTNDNKVYSPFREYYYGKLENLIGKELVCEDFEECYYPPCGIGFYATNVEGIIYALYVSQQDDRIFEVEMSGRNVKFNEYKWRWEKQTIIKMLSDEEAKELIKQQSNKMDWNYYNACYPINPEEIEVNFEEVKDKAIKLLKEWNSVWDNVCKTIRNTVSNNISYIMWDIILNNMFSMVGNNIRGWNNSWGENGRSTITKSVLEIFYAYIGSLFPNIKQWEGVEHKAGIYPYQSGADLWKMGIIASLDGEIWRLHTGKEKKIVYEISREELRKEN